jgi:hypothetical protein
MSARTPHVTSTQHVIQCLGLSWRLWDGAAPLVWMPPRKVTCSEGDLPEGDLQRVRDCLQQVNLWVCTNRDQGTKRCTRYQCIFSKGGAGVGCDIEAAAPHALSGSACHCVTMQVLVCVVQGPVTLARKFHSSRQLACSIVSELHSGATCAVAARHSCVHGESWHSRILIQKQQQPNQPTCSCQTSACLTHGRAFLSGVGHSIVKLP